ncbi:unnamed protein product [Sphagnum balticum]
MEREECQEVKPWRLPLSWSSAALQDDEKDIIMEMIQKNELLQIVKGVQPCLLQHVLEMEVGNIEASQEALQEVGPNFMMLVKTDGDDP